MNPLVITVSQLNKYVRSMLEGDSQLSSVFVVGEISNFKAHYASGHLYFSLNDENGLIRSVMFRTDALKLRFIPEDGMRVICRGRVSLWERDGQYQFYITDMQPDGAGSLALAFEQVKKKLENEGLFAQEIKKPLPEYPEQIAVVTSDTGAALQDILSILNRRFPLCRVVVCPVLVQGGQASRDMRETLLRLYRRQDIDLILIGRGGGSAEDLSAFNDEQLARVIRHSPVPVVSAVGHETDYTICDFVADLRAPTPSAAAELVVPDRTELQYRIAKLNSMLCSAYQKQCTAYGIRLEEAKQSRALSSPQNMLAPFFMRKDAAYTRLCSAYKNICDKKSVSFKLATASLQALSPLNILTRGYTVATKNGRLLRSGSEIANGDTVSLQFSDDTVSFIVDQVRYTNE